MPTTTSTPSTARGTPTTCSSTSCGRPLGLLLTYPAVRPRRSTAPPHRDRVRAAPVPAHLCDLAAASRRRNGEREGTAGPRLDHHHGRHLPASDRRGQRATLEAAGWFTGREVRP